MKIAIDDCLELEFSPWELTEGSKRIEEIRVRHKERGDSVLRAVFTLLLFGQIEQKNNGVLRSLQHDAEKIAETLDGLKAEDCDA